MKINNTKNFEECIYSREVIDYLRAMNKHELDFWTGEVPNIDHVNVIYGSDIPTDITLKGSIINPTYCYVFYPHPSGNGYQAMRMCANNKQIAKAEADARRVRRFACNY